MNAQPKVKIPRRNFFGRMSDGLLGGALAHLFCHDYFGGTSALASEPNEPANLHPRPGHHPARARSVIQLFMNGGPSQMDLFDPKPKLNRMDGKPFPGNVEEIGNQSTTAIGVMMGGRYPFAQHGQSGHCLLYTSDAADE